MLKSILVLLALGAIGANALQKPGVVATFPSGANNDIGLTINIPLADRDLVGSIEIYGQIKALDATSPYVAGVTFPSVPLATIEANNGATYQAKVNGFPCGESILIKVVTLDKNTVPAVSPAAILARAMPPCQFNAGQLPGVDNNFCDYTQPFTATNKPCKPIPCADAFCVNGQCRYAPMPAPKIPCMEPKCAVDASGKYNWVYEPKRCPSNVCEWGICVPGINAATGAFDGTDSCKMMPRRCQPKSPCNKGMCTKVPLANPKVDVPGCYEVADPALTFCNSLTFDPPCTNGVSCASRSVDGMPTQDQCFCTAAVTPVP